jgi:hypothetical protein
MMSQQDHPDALAQHSQREQKKQEEDKSMNLRWEREEDRFRDCGNGV